MSEAKADLGVCGSLYQGKLGLKVAEAQHLSQGLDLPEAVADVAASANWLTEHCSPKVMRREKMKD